MTTTTRLASRILACLGAAVSLCCAADPPPALPDPATVTLATYRLPASAAADGDLSEWAGVPGYGADRYFRRMDKAERLPASDEFAPTLYAGMKPGSPDLYFLILLRDRYVYTQETGDWMYGDYAELFLDFGREARDRNDPEWRKHPAKSPDMGQFGFQPRSALVGDKLFRPDWTPKAWKLDYVSVPVEGGIAFEVHLDGASVLADLKLAAMPALIGLDIGLMDLNYPILLEGGGWANTYGIFRMFGDWSVIAHPGLYGGLSLQPATVIRQGLPGPVPPKTLPALYGAKPTAAAVQAAIDKLPPAQLADCVYWAGCCGVEFAPPLVTALMALEAPRVREAVLTVMQSARQPRESRILATRLAYAAGRNSQTPLGWVLANLLNEELQLGFSRELAKLLDHPDLVVAFTAASALARNGTAAEVAPFEQAVQERLAALSTNAADANKAGAVRVFMQPALEALRTRIHPPPLPTRFTRRVPETANTDLPRVFANDNNTLYNAAHLARRWPAEGPRELWRAEIGGGMAAVIEAGGRVFALAKEETTATNGVKAVSQSAVCLDALKGTLLWKKPLVPRGGSYMAASPVADGDRVYFAPEGAIVCLKAADGTEVWREEKQFAGPAFSTPLIQGDTLYVPCNALAAADKLTGRLLWKTPGPNVGPGSPAYQELDGVAQIVLPVGTGKDAEVWGVSATNGAVFWRFPIKVGYGLCTSPVLDGSRVLLNSGVTGQEFFTLLQMSVAPAAAGQPAVIRAFPVYSRRDSQCAYADTAAVLGEAVYGIHNTSLQCSRLADGEPLWTQTGPGIGKDGHVLLADGLGIAQSGKSLVLFEATPEAYREAGRFTLPVPPGLQQPTLANGRLYVRGAKHVVCYQLGEAP